MEAKNLLNRSLNRWIEWDSRDDETAPYLWRVRWFLYGLFAMVAFQYVGL